MKKDREKSDFSAIPYNHNELRRLTNIATITRVSASGHARAGRILGGFLPPKKYNKMSLHPRQYQEFAVINDFVLLILLLAAATAVRLKIAPNAKEYCRELKSRL